MISNWVCFLKFTLKGFSGAHGLSLFSNVSSPTILFLYAAYAALYSVEVSITKIGKNFSWYLYGDRYMLHIPLVKIR